VPQRNRRAQGVPGQGDREAVNRSEGEEAMSRPGPAGPSSMDAASDPALWLGRPRVQPIVDLPLACGYVAALPLSEDPAPVPARAADVFPPCPGGAAAPRAPSSPAGITRRHFRWAELRGLLLIVLVIATAHVTVPISLGVLLLLADVWAEQRRSDR